MYRIAVVEDERIEANSICSLIQDSKRNWEVVAVAFSGPEALELIAKTDPHIILLDISIPEMDGLEVLRRIKKADPYKRVIIITAHTDIQYAQVAIKGRVDDFLLKPIRKDQLYEAIQLVSETIEENTPQQFLEKRKKIIYNIINMKYRETYGAVHEFIDLLFERYGSDLVMFKNEIQILLSDLRTATMGISSGGDDPTELFNSNADIYQNWYILCTELMRVVDQIFDNNIEGSECAKVPMRDILNYIDRNCRKDISLNQVGEFANMSTYYLSKLFKKETGENFVSYITGMRVMLAKDMLEYTDIPVLNIAMELSYHEPNYFSKVFKKSTGLTPTQYRKKKKENK